MVEIIFLISFPSMIYFWLQCHWQRKLEKAENTTKRLGLSDSPVYNKTGMIVVDDEIKESISKNNTYHKMLLKFARGRL